MRIVFMGTPDFSVAPLKALIEGGHEILAVVTQPDKPKGRGKAVQMTPVKEEGSVHSEIARQPVKVREPEFIQVMKDLAPDVIVVVALWSDYPTGNPGPAPLWLHQYPRLPAAKVPGSRAHSVGGD